ncbi:MAG: PQQ-binding-like beta-propeller repeat protein [Haloferacaceae archaeon]
MPSITRRRLLGGGIAVASATLGGALYRGATDAAFASWTPAPGTWPHRRYDPANTAHNPHATPPRETPTVREVTSVSTAAKRPSFRPVVGPDHVALSGTGFAAYPRNGGDPVHDGDASTPLAAFGPDGRLHAVRRDPDGVDAPSAVVDYAADGLGEVARLPLGADHPQSLTVGSNDVYVATVDAGIHALSPGGGRRWRADGTIAALGDGRLYAAGALDGTVAYGRRTGVDRRLRVGPERVWHTGSDPAHGFPHRPAVADGRLVIGTYAEGGGAVAAVDAGSGDLLWDPRPLGRDVATPALAGERGYTAVDVGERDAGLVVALDLATGETRWRDDVAWTAVAPAVGGDVLVVAGEREGTGEATRGVVRAYDVAAGDVLWTHVVGTGVPGGLALVADRVLVTVGATLYELA